jgi:tetratricopeptide (TPR) repeat protein
MHRTIRVASIAALLALAWGCTSSDTAKRQFLENGNRLIAEKKYAEAILEYRNALKEDDKFPEARVQLAEALAASGNAEGAYREYQRAADLLPNDAVVQKRAATLLFMAGQYEDVRTRVQDVLKKNPKDVEAQILYANALVGLKDLEGGVSEIEEAIQIDPNNAATYTSLALLKMAQGAREAAELAFKKAVELDPKSLKARIALTYFQLSTGNLPLAEASLGEVLALAPRDVLANRTLAALYVGTGRDAAAEKPLRVVAEAGKTPQSKYALADYYIRLKRMAEATAILQPMARDPLTRADARLRLAQITYNSGKLDEGRKQLDQVIKNFPNHAGAQLLKARWLLADGRPAQALDRATAAVNAQPSDPIAHYFRGTLQAMNGQRDAAAKSFNDVLRLNPRAVAAQVQLAQLSLRGGDATHAVSLAEEAVANRRATPEARLVFARALIAQNDLPRAEAELARLVSAFPKAPGVYAAKGTLELLKGNAAGARQAFQTAFDADPSSIAALSGLTLLDVQQRRLAEARARVEKRVAAEPKRADLLVVAAKVYVAEGNLAKAEQALRQTLELAPMLPEPYVILTDIYRTQQRLDAARADYDALLQRNGANLGARTMAATLMHAQGKLEDAKRRYTEVLERDPRAAVAANNLAWIYADERQNLDLALDLAERATEQIPDYAEAWDTLGWVYQQKQLPLLAVVPFEKAVEKDPNNATFHFHLGLALTGAGDRDRARESLQTALKLQPDFPDAQREMKALAQ